MDFVGNRTECALLMMLRKWEVRALLIATICESYIEVSLAIAAA